MVDVYGWDASDESIKCPTISRAIVYDHPISGQVYILVYHQAINFPRLKNHLMCPMQSHLAGVRINELPKFLAEDPYEQTHAIIFDDPLNPNEPLITLLVLKGVTMYFPSSKPRESEYSDELIPYIDMTIEAPVYEPIETSFEEK